MTLPVSIGVDLPNHQGRHNLPPCLRHPSSRRRTHTPPWADKSAAGGVGKCNARGANRQHKRSTCARNTPAISYAVFFNIVVKQYGHHLTVIHHDTPKLSGVRTHDVLIGTHWAHAHKLNQYLDARVLRRARPSRRRTPLGSLGVAIAPRLSILRADIQCTPIGQCTALHCRVVTSTKSVKAFCTATRNRLFNSIVR